MDKKQDNTHQICKKCNKEVDPEEKKYLFLPIGYVDPATKILVLTEDWCMLCCINVEKCMI